MIFIDTHSHLYAKEFAADIEDAVLRAEAVSVKKILLPDIDSKDRPNMMELHKKYPEICLPMIGLHPTSVKEDYKNELAEIVKTISIHKFYGIGETGIDLYWDKTFIKEQIESFEFQIELALKHNLPIVIHARKSLNEIFAILKNHISKGLTGVFHCFPGTIQEAQKVVDMGFYLGIGGVVTYKNSTMADVVRHFSLEHILLETDSPYLTPVPHRGKRNESSFIPLIAEFIANLKNTDTDKVAEVTSANAVKLFHL